jgi:PncC family amidohydrolase
MARGVRMLLETDIGLAVTGVAGPDGGTPDKPVGLVYIALAAPEGEQAERKLWRGERGGSYTRSDNKALSAEAVLDLLMRYLQGQLW